MHTKSLVVSLLLLLSVSAGVLSAQCPVAGTGYSGTKSGCTSLYYCQGSVPGFPYLCNMQSCSVTAKQLNQGCWPGWFTECVFFGCANPFSGNCYPC